MSKLAKDLQNWVSRGFLSAEQSQKILAYESEKPEHSWFLIGVLILGVSIVGIGVISLIAANWKDIPGFVKLSFDFLLLSALAYGTYYNWKLGQDTKTEMFATGFVLACLASIGLISQVFHIGGELYSALLLWVFITAGATFIGKHVYIYLMWSTGFLLGLAMAAEKSPLFLSMFNRNIDGVTLFISILAALLTILSRQFFHDKAPTRALRICTITMCLIAVLVAELEGMRNYNGAALLLTPFTPGIMLSFAVAIAVLMGKEFNRIQKIFLMGALMFFNLNFLVFHLVGLSQFAHAICTLATFSCLGLYFVSLHHKELFQAFLFAFGIRILILYFQALGGLAATGIGLILSGGVIIGMAYLWKKYRKEVTQWAEGWTT